MLWDCDWTFDLKSPVLGSPLLADGKVYLGDGDGDLAVFRAKSKAEKPSVIDMADSVYSTPVPANGVLYVMTRIRRAGTRRGMSCSPRMARGCLSPSGQVRTLEKRWREKHLPKLQHGRRYTV